MIKRIFHITIIVLGVLAIAVSVIGFIASTSITLGTIMPAVTGVLLLAYGFIHIYRPGNILKNKIFRIIVIVLIAAAIMSFLAIETLIIVAANTNIQEEEVNYVIVLGAGVFPDGRITLTLKNRLDKAYDYLEEYEQVICVVSGGKGENEPVAEAQAMKDYLLGRGIEEKRIITEPDSVSTEENMIFSAKLMQDTYPDKKMIALIATSEFHIFRAILLANKSGIDAYGMPAVTPWYIRVNCYTREYFAVVNTLMFQ